MQRTTRSAKTATTPSKPAKSSEPRKPAPRKKLVEPPAPVAVKRSSSVKSRASTPAKKEPKVKAESKSKSKTKDVIVDVKLEEPKPQTKAEPKTEGLLEFEQFLQTQFAPPTTSKAEAIVKMPAKEYTFAPTRTKGGVVKRKTPEPVKAEEPVAVKSELLTMKMTKHVNREEAQKRAGQQVEEHDRKKVTIENSAFGFSAPAATGKAPLVKEDKAAMNEENWHLQQQEAGAYIPNKLPFVAGPKQSEGPITLKPVSNKATVSELLAAGRDSQECMLVQLPGTLPFESLVPHDGKAIEGLKGSTGKLRIMKSGKVVLRFTREDGSVVDLRVNKGIQPGFY